MLMPESLAADDDHAVRRRTCDHANALAFAAGEGADRWTGADVADVDLVGEQGFDQCGTRVELPAGELRGADGFFEVTRCDGEDSLSMGQVREKAQPNLGDRRTASGLSCGG